MLQILILAVVIAVLVFSVYSIIRVIAKKRNEPIKETMYDIPYKKFLDEPEVVPVAVAAHVEEKQVQDSIPAPLREPIKDPNELPSVPGQTTEELKQSEPLQDRVSQTLEESPNPTDPYDKKENSALFGSNLRHPEAMMSNAGVDRFATLDSDVASGVASTTTRPVSADEGVFAAEMAQNGGEFMKGIFAFDSGESGTQYSAY